MTSGSACDAGSWAGGGIGVLLLSRRTSDTAVECMPYDASRYTGIAFDARGSGTLRIEVASTQNNDEDFAGYEFTVSDSWSRYEVRWLQMTQGGWGTSIGGLNAGRIWKVQWLSKTANFSFAIDNVTFLTN
ncbi:MAG: carbohydrate binding domain-containing protein [Polyangiaceae bacterium]